ncbi:serine/threonine protein kinase [Pleurocapsales cyanobacterium LEGE 06147]|nr:serine/threonine protein kinase [Pleurocapsales cyanobacterium LEGE 06147]
MNNLPDFSIYGYRLIKELGRNREGGRITWKAVDLSNENLVVIKQFCFAIKESTWSGYQAYEREIKLLQQLNHPGIPRYLGCIETQNGFCIIQEYKDALSLAERRNFNLDEIKIITTKILEILVYLQKQIPPILHRDLKPENILVDKDLNVYLIDFGFASLGNKQASASSIFKGTPGFMAPEQIIQPTKASDLYSLGVTIICLLTGKTTTDIQELAKADNPYLLEFKPLLAKLNRKFINWLQKMVQPKASKRFHDAAEALAALPPLEIVPQTKNNLLEAKIILRLAHPTSLGLMGMSFLSAIVVVAVNLASKRVEYTVFHLAIALLGAVVIAVGEIGAAIVSNTETQARTEAAILAVTIPAILVVVAALMLGWGEAIAMTAAVTCAETITLGYVLVNQLPAKKFSLRVTVISLLLSMGLGMGIGLGLINGFFW